MQTGERFRVAVATAVALVAAAVLALPLSAQSGDWLSGRIVESGTGVAVPGAMVTLAGSGLTVASAEDGRWRIGPLAPGDHVVRVAHIGYAEAQVSVSPSNGPLRIELTPRPLDLEALVVTAGRRSQALAETVVTTELVSRAEIERSGATDLAAVLIERTGVDLQGGHPAGTGVMLQGLGSERVLILMDGQPYIGRIAGVTDVSRIPTSMIQRIEVVKGPQSTLHGSEAMGGVINVVTRRPTIAGMTASASVVTGQQGRLDASGQAMAGVGALSVLGEVGRRTIEVTPGHDIAPGGMAERWDGMAKARWRSPLEALSAELSLLGLDERQRWRTGQLYHFADNRQWAARTAAEWRFGNHRLAPTLYATGFDHLFRRATSDEPVAGTGDEETQRLYEAELLYGFQLESFALDAGVESRLERIGSTRVTGGDREQTTLEAFAQPTFEWGELTLAPGIRATHSEVWGTHFTPRIAALYRPLPGVALRVSLGEGFRAPDFKELYMEFLNVGPGFGYVVRGNPELEPELSRNVTASAEWNAQKLYVRVQGFETRFDRFIETVAVEDSAGLIVYRYGNVDDGTTRGLELESGVNHGPWRLEAGASLLRAERAATGEPLLGRPSGSVRASLGWAHPSGVRATLSGVRTGRTPMSREGDRTLWRDAYLRFDARIAQRLPGGLELIVGADNLLDAAVDEWPGFTGRHIYVGLTWEGSADPLDFEAE